MNGDSARTAQHAKRRADPKPVIAGGGLSVLFLVFFFFLQSHTAPLAKIPEAFLWFSLVPLVVGLFVGGYISGVKWGEFEVGIPEDLQKELKPVEGQSALPMPTAEGQTLVEAKPRVATGGEMSSDDLRASFADHYENQTKHYMLAHIYRPSKAPAQFEIFIFVVRHERGSHGPPKMTKFEEIQSAEFYLGPSWRDQIFPVENKQGLLGIHTRAWGTFPACCRLKFKEGPPVVLYRFVDFYMDSNYREEAFSGGGLSGIL